ncbi:hypothetical protein GGF31_003443 [Allomyces arbusculus]|nr:hypothetical protein GGF31_003443 [Allomyces arbusculus]
MHSQWATLSFSQPLTTSGFKGITSGDLNIVLYNVPAFGGFREYDINRVYFTVRDIINKDTFMFTWNVNDYPENAKIGEGSDARPISVPELFREICSGEFVLYVPLNPGAEDVVVLQKMSIRKRHITILDILHKIWHFYNIRTPDVESIQSLFTSAASKDHARSLFIQHEQGLRLLRFRDFLTTETGASSLELKSFDPVPGTINAFTVTLGSD